MIVNGLSNKLLQINIIDKAMNKIKGFGYVSSDSLWDAKKVIALDIVKTLSAYRKTGVSIVSSALFSFMGLVNW